jgi:hypothetical protein
MAEWDREVWLAPQLLPESLGVLAPEVQPQLTGRDHVADGQLPRPCAQLQPAEAAVAAQMHARRLVTRHSSHPLPPSLAHSCRGVGVGTTAHDHVHWQTEIPPRAPFACDAVPPPQAQAKPGSE